MPCQSIRAKFIIGAKGVTFSEGGFLSTQPSPYRFGWGPRSRVSCLTLAPMLAQLQEVEARQGGEGNRDKSRKETNTNARTQTRGTAFPTTRYRLHALPLSSRLVLHAKHRKRYTRKMKQRQQGQSNPPPHDEHTSPYNCLTAAQSLLWVPLRPGGTLSRSSPKQRTEIPADVSMPSAQECSGLPSREPRKKAGRQTQFHSSTWQALPTTNTNANPHPT